MEERKKVPMGDAAAVARAINGIVAPAIMISASALMILALQGKYSHLTDRLRSLNEEKRKLELASEPQRSAERRGNVICQIDMILERAKLVRNSIVSLYSAIGMFVASSIVIGVALTLGISIPVAASLAIFLLGMVFVLLGTYYALRDITRAFTVAEIEVCGLRKPNNNH